MKTYRIFTAMLLVFAAMTNVVTTAQVRINIVNNGGVMKTEPVDDLMFTAEYKMTFVEDTAKRNTPMEEMMMLEVGSKVSLYHSYGKMIVDSIVAASIAAGTSMEAIGDKVKGLSSTVTYKIYKNYPQGKVTTLDQIAMDRYRCEEVNERPEWEILTDTATVLSYHCQKAVCHFKGRTYEAWFTTEIPKSDGPWKLNGLPGLIMRAVDSRGDYRFECVAIVHKEGKIQFGATGYEPITRKNMNRQFERFASDPIGYSTANNPNMKIMIKNEAGESVRPMNTPYNPIELSE